jgi:hypothetical protein
MLGAGLGKARWSGPRYRSQSRYQRQLVVRNPFDYPADSFLKPLAIDSSSLHRVNALTFQLSLELLELGPGRVAVGHLHVRTNQPLDVSQGCVECLPQVWRHHRAQGRPATSERSMIKAMKFVKRSGQVPADSYEFYTTNVTCCKPRPYVTRPSDMNPG